MKPIFYVEDSEDEVLLLEKALKDAGVKNPLISASDASEAISFLSKAGIPPERGGTPIPCLVLLDIKLPGTSGLELLKWLRSTPTTCSLPILMLSSSTHESDIHRAYLQGANGFLEKPVDIKDFSRMVNAIRDYWLVHNKTVNGSSAPPWPRALHGMKHEMSNI